MAGRPALALLYVLAVVALGAAVARAGKPKSGAPHDPCDKLLGCVECKEMSPTHVEAVRAEHKKRIADLKAKLAAKGIDNTAWATRIAALEAKLDGDWPGNRTLHTCAKCSPSFDLAGDHCVCKPGTGVTFSRPADGSPPPKPSSLECKACAKGTASGPDVKPEWLGKAKPDFGAWHNGKKGADGAKKGAPAAKKDATTGRRLAGYGPRGAGGGGGHGGPGRWHEWRASMCVPCPSGVSNDAHTKCETP